MYPTVPYEGISWPITQHAGVISKDVLLGLLNACVLCNGETIDPKMINGYLVEHNILTANFRSDSNQVDAWRDYQQILSEFGFIYSTRISKVLRLTPVALALINGRLTYEEAITLQIMRYQYPNGHKSQLSPSLIESYGTGFSFSSYTEMQDAKGILFRPAILVWEILYSLWQKGELAVLSLDEMQAYVVRCTNHNDVDSCIRALVDNRHGVSSLSPLPRARRNMADWLKILNQTPLFTLSTDGDNLALSSFSVRESRIISNLCKQMAVPGSFWVFTENDFKKDWFDFYGDFDSNTDWVLKIQ
ncbi:MAG: AlwI family type II restriction endonuclease [Oscillospiraceae bacterium]|nr:AlwI family type II restriction endonuclease [Oscillospiraceae bacterium]